MDEPRLKINSTTEIPLSGRLMTLGRAQDNDVAFTDDSNVSRYHAEIELREDDYWIIDLGSFNGTKVNGESLTGEKPLNDGDLILLGGTSKIEVLFSPAEKDDGPAEEAASQEEAPPPDETPALPKEPAAAQKSSKFSLMLIVAALAVGLAVIFVAAAALFYFTRGTAACEAQAMIIKPERGDVLKETTEIEVEITNSECVSRASYTIEGKEFASSTEPPFSVSIEPGEFPEFSDGLNRNLKVILYDENDIEINQSQEIAFFIETIEVETPTPTPAVDVTGDPGSKPNGNDSRGPEISARDSIAMTGNVIKQFSGKFEYKNADPGFLRAVQEKTAEYASEGYYERAQKYRDVINIAFIREQNLDPPLGYILAMSRSKFSPKNNAEGTGLWRMSEDFVVSNAYNGLCGVETIASASQNCAAKASALYLKALILNVFEGDVVYGVAAFGMSPQEAEAWKSSLPANRSDFWNVIKSPAQREEVVNFFAAAMVAENPQKFGLKNDKPLSGLYSVFMK